MYLIVDRLAKMLGCKVETLPSKYLGFSLGASRRAKDIWSLVVERIERKFAAGKSRHLRLGGVFPLWRVFFRAFLSIICLCFPPRCWLLISIRKCKVIFHGMMQKVIGNFIWLVGKRCVVRWVWWAQEKTFAFGEFCSFREVALEVWRGREHALEKEG